MHSPGNSTFALSPVGRKKPATLLVPEPRNYAETQAEAHQAKRSAATRGLRQSQPSQWKRGGRRDLCYSWRRSWDLCGKCSFTLVTDLSRCLRIRRGGELCGVCTRDLPRGLGRLLAGSACSVPAELLGGPGRWASWGR